MNELEILAEELKRPKSRRRKKILKKIDGNLISKIESEIIKINHYLTKKIIQDRNYRPTGGDEDQPFRDRVNFLYDLKSKLKSLN